MVKAVWNDFILADSNARSWSMATIISLPKVLRRRRSSLAPPRRSVGGRGWPIIIRSWRAIARTLTQLGITQTRSQRPPQSKAGSLSGRASRSVSAKSINGRAPAARASRSEQVPSLPPAALGRGHRRIRWNWARIRGRIGAGGFLRSASSALARKRGLTVVRASALFSRAGDGKVHGGYVGRVKIFANPPRANKKFEVAQRPFSGFHRRPLKGLLLAHPAHSAIDRSTARTRPSGANRFRFGRNNRTPRNVVEGSRGVIPTALMNDRHVPIGAYRLS